MSSGLCTYMHTYMNVCLYTHEPSRTQTCIQIIKTKIWDSGKCARRHPVACKIAAAGCRDRKLPAMATPPHEECHPGLLSCLRQMDSGQGPPWACKIPHQACTYLETTLLGHLGAADFLSNTMIKGGQLGILSPPHSPGPGEMPGALWAQEEHHMSWAGRHLGGVCF